jgi:hypothetical protein
MAGIMDALKPLGDACFKFADGNDIIRNGHDFHMIAPYLGPYTDLNIGHYLVLRKHFFHMVFKEPLIYKKTQAASAVSHQKINQIDKIFRSSRVPRTISSQIS